MINLIAACGHNRVIGNKGKLPWNIEEDWNYFLETTQDGILIMGRRCYEDFEKFATDRQVIALSRNPEHTFARARKSGALTDAIEVCRKEKKIAWICGGSEIYEEAIPIADRLYLTLIDAPFEGDVFFPPWEDTFRHELSSKKVRSGQYELTFRVLEK
jgi:dihydrofolate reductase